MAEVSCVSMSVKAFTKPLLHAVKYPHCSVNGVFLTDADPLSSSASSGSHDNTVRYVDAIPLFHSSLTLAPMMEVALTQIDVYCKTNNLVIAGYYQANENLDNNKPIGVAMRLADKIKEASGDASLIMVDNRKVLHEAEDAFIVYTCHDTKWKKSEDRASVPSDAAELWQVMLKSRAYRELVDFDNYLDDITCDWLNPDINDQLGEQN